MSIEIDFKERLSDPLSRVSAPAESGVVAAELAACWWRARRTQSAGAKVVRPRFAASLDAYLVDVAAQLARSEYLDGCPIATVALEVGAASQEIGDACADAFERLIGRVASWIEADGANPITTRDRATLVYAAIEGALVFAKAQRSLEPLTRLRTQLPRLLATSDARASWLTAVRVAGSRRRRRHAVDLQ